MSIRVFEILLGLGALFVALFLSQNGMNPSQPTNKRFWMMLCIAAFIVGWGITAIYTDTSWGEKLMFGCITSLLATLATISRRRYFRSLKRK